MNVNDLSPQAIEALIESNQLSQADIDSLKRPKKNKYGARKAEIDGMLFHSSAEARRYSELKLLQQAGEIAELRCQVKFRLEVDDVHICDYIADFTYADRRKGSLPVVEDVKGYKKGNAYAIFTLKKKLMLAIYGINILETK